MTRAMRFVARSDGQVFDIVELPINEKAKEPLEGVVRRWARFVKPGYGKIDRLDHGMEITMTIVHWDN